MNDVDLQQYRQLFESKRSGTVSGLCGRIIHGTRPEHFKTLTYDPDRKLVMITDSDGLEKLLGKSGYDILVAIGYEPNYIMHKVVNEGSQFKLVVFPESGVAKLATWDNVVKVIRMVYSEVADLMDDSLITDLKKHSFADLQWCSGFTFSEVCKIGKSDKRFMTYDRFRVSSRNIWEIRAFLYFTIHLYDLFCGDGYTYDARGNRGLKEYIIPNMPLTDIGPHIILDIPNIEIPA